MPEKHHYLKENMALEKNLLKHIFFIFVLWISFASEKKAEQKLLRI